jgi:hypothetical protein
MCLYQHQLAFHQTILNLRITLLLKKKTQMKKEYNYINILEIVPEGGAISSGILLINNLLPLLPPTTHKTGKIHTE